MFCLQGVSSEIQNMGHWTRTEKDSVSNFSPNQQL